MIKDMSEEMMDTGSADVPVGLGKDAGGDAGAPRRGWYTRGYLPHRDEPSILQSITYRLADSLPQTKLEALQAELATLSETQREPTRRRSIEAWLDAGMGCCALAHPEVARYVQNSWLHYHGERYVLHAWCVMPNRVHILIEPRMELATIVQGWKSFTSRWILRQNTSLNLGIPASGQLWMREYWDRYIRGEDHYRKVVDYIHRNPVAAGLCTTPEEWCWSSAGSAGVPAGFGKGASVDASAPRR